MGKVFCCYCGKVIVYPLIDTTEHLVPISKGGNNLLANKKRCCHRCNNWRGNSSLNYFKLDVQYHIDNKLKRAGYSSYDFEIMIENIDYWRYYIETSKDRLLRKKTN